VTETIMKTDAAHINLVFAWLWILLGFASGMMLGLFFHREKWLGGYGSFPRRMYRLGHISFFGLGAVNLLFWLTPQRIAPAASIAQIASWASWTFIVGGVTMPVCCLAMAHWPKARLAFAVPVLNLILGALLTLILLDPFAGHSSQYVGSQSSSPPTQSQSQSPTQMQMHIP
jgi:hypothetical protein